MSVAPSGSCSIIRSISSWWEESMLFSSEPPSSPSILTLSPIVLRRTGCRPASIVSPSSLSPASASARTGSLRGTRSCPVTYESASCQVRVSTAEKPQIQASQPLFEYTTSELAGDRAMLASNPSTEPEAEMREGRTPDLPSPARPIPSRHQAPNAGVRGRAPSRDLLPVHLPLRTTFVPLRSGLRS